MQNNIRSYNEHDKTYTQYFIYGIPEDLSNFEQMYHFSRYGYSFIGWTEQPDNTVDFQNAQTVSNLTTVDDATVNLYALWEPREYVIQYNPNGVVGKVYYQTAFYDTELTLSGNQFELSDYNFIGWSTLSDDIEAEYADEDIVKNLGATAPYNFYDPINLYPVYDLSGDSVSDIINIINGELSDIELSVQYNSNCYPGRTKLVEVDNNFSVDGYFFESIDKSKVFKSWSQSSTMNSGIDAGMNINELSNRIPPISGIINLYAFWSYPYYIKFHGATPSFDKISSVTGSMGIQTCAIDVSAPLEKNQFKCNWHSHIGWTSSDDSQRVEYVDGETIRNIARENETINLYALWNNEYFVNYRFDDIVLSQTCSYDVSTVLSNGNDMFLKENHECIGWSSTSSHNVIYKNGEVVTNITPIDGNIANLSAQWSSIYYIRFFKDAIGGSEDVSGTMEDQRCVYGISSKLLKNAFYKPNYVFSNWIDSNGTEYQDEEQILNLTTVPGEIVNVSAMWKPYVFEYRYDDENMLAYLCATYGNPTFVEIPSETSRHGEDYTVAGIDIGAFFDYTILNDMGLAYVRCDNILKAVVPPTLSVISFNAFHDLINLREVQYLGDTQISAIDVNVFSNCTSLPNVVVPSTVTSVGDRGFYRCEVLTSFNSLKPLQYIGSEAFYNTNVQVTFNDLSNVIEIGGDAFKDCGGVGGLNLIRCRHVDDGAFYNCFMLSDVYLGENVDITDGNLGNVFSFSNTNIDDFKINTSNKHIKIISDSLFYECAELSDVIINNSMLSICDDAFNGCSSISIFDIPSSVTYIGENVFLNASKLSNIIVHENNKHYFSDEGVLYKYVSEEDYDVPDTLSLLLDELSLLLSDINELSNDF